MPRAGVRLRATSARGGTARRGPARAARSSAAPEISFNGSEPVREDCLSTARAGPSSRGQIEARSEALAAGLPSVGHAPDAGALVVALPLAPGPGPEGALPQEAPGARDVDE